MILNIYVDGSYSKRTPNMTFGGIVITKGSYSDEEVILVRHIYSDNPIFTKTNNAGGEVLSSLVGIMDAAFICNGEKSILNIFYDYKGVKEFLTGGYVARDAGMVQYVSAVHAVLNKNPNIELKFHKVKSHTGVRYNELADSVARGVIPSVYDHCRKEDMHL